MLQKFFFNERKVLEIKKVITNLYKIQWTILIFISENVCVLLTIDYPFLKHSLFLGYNPLLIYVLHL